MNDKFALMEAFALIAEAVDEFNNIGCDDIANHFEKNLIRIQEQLYKAKNKQEEA
jgi:hypothetical protein